MKLTLIGGSHGTGLLLAQCARAAGHEVTVVSRRGVAPHADRVIIGDARDSAIITEAMTDADAAVVTVGGAKGAPRHRTAVTESVITAMHEAGVRRLVVQSSLGAGASSAQLSGPLGLLTKLALAGPLADHTAQEAVVFGSGLDWTIARPTGLTGRPARGSWRTAETAADGRLGGTITRADLAAFLLESLEDDATMGRALGISN